MKVHKFHRRNDGSYRCESYVPGEGACLVRRQPNQPDRWETATIPPEGTLPKFVVCPVATAWTTRLGAVTAHFYFHQETP